MRKLITAFLIGLLVALILCRRDRLTAEEREEIGARRRLMATRRR